MTVSFGSSGIRGPYGGKVTPELALAIGRAVGSMRQRVVVGRDARTTGPLLQAALTAGLLSAGADVADAGVLPTPALAYAARRHDAGVVVTASHNPAPDNGFKLWEPDGRAFPDAARKEVERLLREPAMHAPWDRVGQATHAVNAVEEHISRILELTGPLVRRLRVVLDCGNGAATRESPELLRRLGCDVVTLNAQPDGHFPGRPSEPSEANVAHLRQAVVATKADLGIAHDGDADRCMAVTGSGRYVTGDQLLVLFAREHAGKRIVCPVDASRIVEDASGCQVVRTKVGDAFVSEAIAENAAAWGGEASGAWIFPEMSSCPDGPYAAAKLCALVARAGPFNKLIDALPHYPLWRTSWPMPPAQVPALLERFEKAFPEGTVNRLDGLKIDVPEGWILVRASGTEPKVRATVEATSEAALTRLRARVTSVSDGGGLPKA